MNRRFNAGSQSQNARWIKLHSPNDGPVRVGFILLPHFSMMSYSAAVDVLVSANLVVEQPLFEAVPLSLHAGNVVSDIGIETLTRETPGHFLNTSTTRDPVIVCGGLRCDLTSNKPLIQSLTRADREQRLVGGLWNGAVLLAHAGVLRDNACAIHPENRMLLQELSPLSTVTSGSYQWHERYPTSANPVGTLSLLLQFLEAHHSAALRQAVTELLALQDPHDTPEHLPTAQPSHDHPDALNTALQLMHANVEEPLCIDELAHHAGSSRRQLERLFRRYMMCSPSRYYLEFRLTQARRLLTQTHYSIRDVACATGFLSDAHFSRCFRDYFGFPPSQCR